MKSVIDLGNENYKNGFDNNAGLLYDPVK